MFLKGVRFLSHRGVPPGRFLADGKLQALTVDEQSIVGGLDVLKHAVVSERVSQLLAVGRDTVQRSSRKGY
jgi:hypothetical protein